MRAVEKSARRFRNNVVGRSALGETTIMAARTLGVWPHSAVPLQVWLRAASLCMDYGCSWSGRCSEFQSWLCSIEA
jgi:hypothetical protein